MRKYNSKILLFFFEEFYSDIGHQKSKRNHENLQTKIYICQKISIQF